MKSLTSEAVFKITQFVNERSVESTDIIHKRNDDGNVVVSLMTDLQPMYCSPNGNRVLTNKGYKVTRDKNVSRRAYLKLKPSSLMISCQCTLTV